MGKLHRASSGKVLAAQTSRLVRPLTPLKSFEIKNLHGFEKTAPPEWLKNPSGYDFEAVLLAHAKLYILSRSQGVNALSDLCISRLRQALDELSSPAIEPPIPRNAVGLLRYVYCSPRGMATLEALQPAWQQLQDLASQFCALNIDVMVAEPGFRAMLQDTGTLATDVMDKTVRRLVSAESGSPSWNHLAAPEWNSFGARDAATNRLFGGPTPAPPAFGQTPVASQGSTLFGARPPPSEPCKIN